MIQKDTLNVRCLFIKLANYQVICSICEPDLIYKILLVYFAEIYNISKLNNNNNNLWVVFFFFMLIILGFHIFQFFFS